MNIEILRQELEGKKIGVVVPTHNYGQYLQLCIDSILGQTFPVDRLIVVNDASTDDTATAWKKLLPYHLKSFTEIEYYEVDFKHANKARNFGLNMLNDCDYLLLFDADNWMESDFIERMCYRLVLSPEVAYAYCDRWMITGEDRELIKFPDFNYHQFANSNFVDFASLMRREVYDQVGPLTEDRDFDVLEDWDFFFKAANKGYTGAHVPSPLYYYRLHPESKSYKLREDTERFRQMKRRILERNYIAK